MLCALAGAKRTPEGSSGQGGASECGAGSLGTLQVAVGPSLEEGPSVCLYPFRPLPFSRY